ncbi:hypothetical protein H7K06_06810 [Priestia aryabhattai]|uniref:hypothetical protein n=1 Tax=Priestia aryabhattai TaxID=412384 RepID=UPI001C8D72B0|nr:hypothetical protein [Priestia aryabhattai]MBX9967227.1 hypothetical protein [Priestia aryabhattai]
MEISGSLSYFPNMIKSNVQLGLFNSKVKPFFKYNGSIYSVNNSRNVNEQLVEIIEEICYIPPIGEDVFNSYIVTRESGRSRTNRPANSRISLIFERNNTLCVWRPLLSEIFEALNLIVNMSGRHYLNVVRDISDKLSSSRDFDVLEIIKNYNDRSLMEYAGVGFIPIGNDLSVSYYSIFSLIKNIMISEDMTYNKDGHLGRYYMQLAIYDYIVKQDGTISDIIKKYGLRY